MDYEYQPASHLAFRAANRVVLPEVFPRAIARRQGGSAHKTRRYQGLKEEIYLGDFQPNHQILQELGIPDRNGRPLIVARTPPTGASYHPFGNPQFDRLIGQLQVPGDCICVVLPRSLAQRKALRLSDSSNVVVPERAVDSRSLIYGADLFIGAGGTMTREAALLGTPTVSVYAGRRPAADVALARRGLLRVLEPAEILAGISTRKAPPEDLPTLRKRADEVTDSFLGAVLN
jgi:predicted glycosyltransferase